MEKGGYSLLNIFDVILDNFVFYIVPNVLLFNKIVAIKTNAAINSFTLFLTTYSNSHMVWNWLLTQFLQTLWPHSEQ